MNKEEMDKLGQIFVTADGGCPYCARDLMEKFNETFSDSEHVFVWRNEYDEGTEIEIFGPCAAVPDEHGHVIESVDEKNTCVRCSGIVGEAMTTDCPGYDYEENGVSRFLIQEGSKDFVAGEWLDKDG